MENSKPIVYLITGPNGAGKTSVSKALALKFEKSSRIKVDDIRKMIVGGYLSPQLPSEEVKDQSYLAAKNTFALAQNFLESGFNVIIDCVMSKSQFEQYSELFKNEPLKIFLLLPSEEVLLQRFQNRGGATKELEEHTKKLYEKFASQKNEVDWKVIDSSNQTIEETTNEIFRELI